MINKTRRALMLVDGDEIVKKETNSLQEISDHFEARLKFLQKQAEDMQNDFNKQRQDCWDRLKARLLDLKKLPEDYTNEKYTVEMDSNRTCLFIYEDAHEPKAKDFIKKIVESIPPELMQ